MIFEVGDQVWVHLRKERFPEERKSKLMPRIDGPFKITRRINNNAYQLDLQGKYNVSSSFNVSDLIPFDADDADLRTNPFQVGGDDMILRNKQEPEMELEGNKHEYKHESEEQGAAYTWSEPVGPMTRSRTKELKEIIGRLLKTMAYPEAIPHGLILIQAK